MIADKLQARDDMLQMFRDTWVAADWGPIGGATPHVVYDGREENQPPQSDQSHARVYIKHADGGQVGFQVGNTGKRKYESTGVIMVQHFGSQVDGRGLETATYMAIIAEKCYQGKTSPNGVWFRHIRSQEVGATGSGYQINTIIDFEYNELR